MEAIFGIWYLNETPVQQALLERMAGALKAAPGKQSALNLHYDGPIGFGRLAIGRAPVEQPPTLEGDLLCVSDARLYRAKNTDAPLDMSPAQRESLLCGLHARFGDEGPNHLEGDFAYVVWDKSRQRLTLVRDHMGVRPMFYFCVPGEFILWASHSDLILGSGLVANDLDINAACRNFDDDTSNMEETAVRGLKRLPAAHVLHVSSDGRTQKRKYWHLACVDPIPDAANFKDSAIQLRRLLDDAVRRRLPSFESIGAHLSGGLDSASISVLAGRALADEKRPLHTYSFVSEHRHDVQFVDERPYVDVTVQGEANIYNTKITPPEHDQQYVDAVPDRLAGFTGAEERVLAAAAADAVDVILSGWGGDEVVSFNGRGAYAEHFIRGRWRTLWRELNERASLLGTSRESVFANEVVSYALPTRLTNFIRRAVGKAPVNLASEQLRALLLPQYQESAKPDKVQAASARKNRLTLFNSGFIAQRLENWALQGMPHGVHYAFPMLDRELLEYSIRLPASFFIRHGLGRAIFREAMKGVLPESVRTSRLKLAPLPCNLLRLSEHKVEHLKELAALREDPQLSQIFDFNAVEAALREVPDPDVVKAAFNAEAAGGESPSLAPALALEPIVFARFLKVRLGR